MGWNSRVIGFDYDEQKIIAGKKMIAQGGYEDISLMQGDAHVDLPPHNGDVTILDVLQFFEYDAQEKLLISAAQRVAPGGKLIIRSGIKEDNLRFFMTWLGDMIAKLCLWMKAAPRHYPTVDFFKTTLEKEGFSVQAISFWGNTPFNNYLIVATRKED